MEKQGKNTFVKGAAILGVAGLIVKLLGAVFRLPLAGMIGAEGMAYYSPAYYAYTVFVVIATSGIPVAISRMVSERITVNEYGEAHRVFQISFRLMMGIGIVTFIIMFFGAGILSDTFNIKEARLSMMSVAPALLFVPIMAAYRGYFQGMQNMKPTAVSQVVEQVVRVFFGLFLGYTLYNSVSGGFLSKYSAGEKGAAGAAFGATLGSLGGLALIYLVYFLSKKVIYGRIRNYGPADSYVSGGEILKKILIIAIPITIGAAITPIMNLIEVPVIMKALLNSGWDRKVANNLYGQISGFCTPIINMPQVLTMALAMSLVPLISSAYKRKDKDELKYNTAFAVKVAMIIGMPCAVGMAVLAEPILLLLYSSRWDEAVSAAPTFGILAIGVIFVSIVQTVSGILQGVGKQNIPVINFAIGLVIKIILTYILVSVKSLNIKGAAIATVITYVIVATLDLVATKKYTGAKFNIMEIYIKPAISTAVMGIVTWVTYFVIFGGVQGHKAGCLVSIFVAGIVYAIMLVVTRTITKDDIANLPGGEKLGKIMDKIGLK